MSAPATLAGLLLRAISRGRPAIAQISLLKRSLFTRQRTTRRPPALSSTIYNILMGLRNEFKTRQLDHRRARHPERLSANNYAHNIDNLNGTGRHKMLRDDTRNSSGKVSRRRDGSNCERRYATCDWDLFYLHRRPAKPKDH